MLTEWIFAFLAAGANAGIGISIKGAQTNGCRTSFYGVVGCIAGLFCVALLLPFLPGPRWIAGGEFIVSVNGMSRTLRSGDRIVLTPGESITIKPFHAHRFYGEKGSGPSMIGEVSMVNDDNDDNCYLDEAVRFDSIAEDQPVRYPLACEYRTLIQAKTSVLQASLNRICS